MNAFDNSHTGEKLLTLSEIKVENDDYYSEHSGKFIIIKLCKGNS